MWAASGCHEDTPDPLFLLMGRPVRRCPRPDATPEIEEIVSLVRRGIVEELGVLGLRQLPNAVAEALEWTHEVIRAAKIAEEAANGGR